MPAIDPTLTVEVISPTLIYVHSDQELVIDANMLDETNWDFVKEFGVDISATNINPIHLSSDPTKTQKIEVTLSGMTFGGKYSLQPLGALGFPGFQIITFIGPPQQFGVTLQDQILSKRQHPHESKSTYLSRLTLQLDFEIDVSTFDLSDFSITGEYPVEPEIFDVEIDNASGICKVFYHKFTDVLYDVLIGKTETEDYWARLADPQAVDGYILQNMVGDMQGDFYASLSATNSGHPAILSFGSDINFDDNIILDIGFFSEPPSSNPNPNTSICIFHVDDGVTLVSILMSSTAIRLLSGSFTATVPFTSADWHKPIRLMRNVKHGLWVLSVGEEAKISGSIASLDGASINPPSVQLVFPATAPYNNTFVHLSKLEMSISKSLFSSFGNPIHNIKTSFQGQPEPEDVIDFFYTGRGPLVKDDLSKHPEPAEVQDVQVYINDVQVDVKSVNPYIGRIELTTPIPRFALGKQTDTIEVDYCWFPNPRLSFAKLNMPGLVLNKWNIKTGRNTSSMLNTNDGGSTQGERFAMCQGLVEHSSINPVEISHRHLGFEDEYTGALNQPMGFVLNAKPHAFSAATAEQRTLWNKSRLNRWNKVHSGEFEKDTTPETVDAILRGGHIQLHHQHIKAKTIFYVMLNGIPLAHDEWSFHHATQLIEVHTERPNSPVTVIFSPDKPLTNTYIEKQSLEGGVTNLNEGTPPMVKTHADLYSSLEFMEVDNGGQTKQIAIADDGPYPGQGFREIDVKGRMVTEHEPIVKQPLVTQGGGAMGMCLVAGGGAYTNLNQLGHLEGGTWRRNPKITWPLHPSNAKPGRGIQRTHWISSHKYEEAVPVTLSLGETSCIAILLDFDGEQRIGPWSDINALTPESLMTSSVDESNDPDGLILQGGNSPNMPTRTVYTLI